MFQMLPTSHVFTRRDARKTNEDAVRSLMESIREVGIINPIRVRAARCFIEGVEGDGYEVIAGAHRLRAALKLGLGEVPCDVVEDDDLVAELVMIDENLMRAELSPADRAKYTARRKALYLIAHPETAHGGDRKSDQVANSATRSDSFVADTAGKTGKAERTVRLDAERGENIDAVALDLIAGTDLDHGTYLDKVKKLTTPEEQRAKVAADLKRKEREAETKRAQESASRQAAKLDKGVQVRAGQYLAELMVEYFPADIMDGVRANLDAAKKIEHISNALGNLVGKSIMDSRFGEAA